MQKHLAISDNFKDLIGETEKKLKVVIFLGYICRWRLKISLQINGIDLFQSNIFQSFFYRWIEIAFYEDRDVTSQPTILTKWKNEHTEK